MKELRRIAIGRNLFEVPELNWGIRSETIAQLEQYDSQRRSSSTNPAGYTIDDITENYNVYTREYLRDISSERGLYQRAAKDGVVQRLIDDDNSKRTYDLA